MYHPGQLQQQQQVNSAQQEPVSKDCCLGRTCAQWWSGFYSLLLCSALLTAACIYWHDCNVISGLNSYCVIAATFQAAIGLLYFSMRPTKLAREGPATTDSELEVGQLVHGLSTACSLICVSIGYHAVIIYGTVLTWGNFDLIGYGPDQCAPPLFIIAFLSTAIPFAIGIVVVVSLLYGCCLGCCVLLCLINKENDDSEPGAANNEANGGSTGDSIICNKCGFRRGGDHSEWCHIAAAAKARVAAKAPAGAPSNVERVGPESGSTVEESDDNASNVVMHDDGDKKNDLEAGAGGVCTTDEEESDDDNASKVMDDAVKENDLEAGGGGDEGAGDKMSHDEAAAVVASIHSVLTGKF